MSKLSNWGYKSPSDSNYYRRHDWKVLRCANQHGWIWSKADDWTWTVFEH